MARILLTGFEPFAGDSGNPSGDAVRALAERWQGPAELITAVLPVTFRHAARQICDLIAAHMPDVVVATGLAGGRSAVSLERVAINLRDARIADNAGHQPVDEPCVATAAPAYFSTLPVKAMSAALGDAGIPAEVSHTAGTFVCNDVFFQAMDAVAAPARAGFMHIPWSTATKPVGSEAPALDDETLVLALDIALRTALTTPHDAAHSAGTLH